MDCLKLILLGVPLLGMSGCGGEDERSFSKQDAGTGATGAVSGSGGSSGGATGGASGSGATGGASGSGGATGGASGSSGTGAAAGASGASGSGGAGGDAGAACDTNKQRMCAGRSSGLDGSSRVSQGRWRAPDLSGELWH